MSQQEPRPFGFPQHARVRRQGDFDRVYQRNVYAADHTLVVQGCENDLAVCRLGLSMSRRVGNAVVRNRWKRLVREAFRLQQEKMPAGLDLVVRPRRGAQPTFDAICDSLPKLARRIDRQIRRARG